MGTRSQKALILAAVFQRDGRRCYDCGVPLAATDAALVDVAVADDGAPARIVSRARAMCPPCARARRAAQRADMPRKQDVQTGIARSAGG